ncbi:hypothetical protein BCR36DRAFT_319935 [Piromyces finnis]|uniref:MI domain-containing protein n=1 Tax=Piromyces finnis TaxID=1754191 RepID=A0A1Y1VJE6_9FUNG|nr:hypothetical protein BCR36DRAFT_319935 [Piromyces finnis]|eukprot:ORX56526.1 hypothetical protein BCR36DRAFT_319935 [Piromyces finnis]
MSLQNSNSFKRNMQDNNRKSINTELRNDVPKYENNIMRSRSAKEVKYNGGGFGDLEDTSDIKHSYSFGSQKMNGMNNMGMNSNFRKERNSGVFSSGSHSPKYGAMKSNRYSQGEYQNQGFSPRSIQISPTNRGSRPPTSPGAFSPTRSSNYGGYNYNRYSQGTNPDSIQKIQRPIGSPVNKWNTGISPINKNEEFNAPKKSIDIVKKKSSAIDIIDPNTNQKIKITAEPSVSTPKTQTIPAVASTTQESTVTGTETPVNDVVDTNNTPLEASQVAESDNTETVVESSDIEEEQDDVKSEVINNNEIQSNKSQNNNNGNNGNNQNNNKKSDKNKNQQKQKQQPQPNIEEIINQRPMDDSKYENKIEIQSFENVKYPENVELPVVKDKFIKYTSAFIMLFKELCPRKSIDIKFIYDSINATPEKSKKNNYQNKGNNQNNKKGKNFNNNNNENNNNGNNNKSNQNERSNSQNKRQSKMGKRNESNQSSRRGMGRSFSRKQQQQQEILPPVKPLEKSENAWKMVKPSEKNSEDLEIKLRKVKGILNKLTLEKFKILADQIVDIGIKDEETLKGIIKEIFDKAIDEPNFGSLYAKLCQYINEELPKKQEWVNIKNTNNNVFRKLMLNRCQEEFENNKDNRWSDGDEDEKPVAQMTDEEKLEYSKKQSERTKKKRRSLGNIRFIGELYMCQMITQKIIRFCFWTLFNQLKSPDEESVECLCFLFRTVGNKVENQLIAIEKDNETLKEWSKEWNRYFSDMNSLSKNKAFPSRMRFMLMDIIELRKNKWKSKDNGPKTIAEIHKEAEKELKEQEIQRNSSRSGSGRSNSNRSDRRGSRRSESMRESMILRANNNKLEKNELNSFGKIQHNGSISNQFLGPQGGKNGRFVKQNSGSRDNSVESINRQSTLTNNESPLKVQSTNIFDALNEEEHKDMVSEPAEINKEIPKMDEEKAKKRIENTFKEFVSQRNLEEALLSIKEIGTNEYNKYIIKNFIDKYADAKENDIESAAELIVELYKKDILSSDIILKEIEENAEFIEEMLFDIPGIYKFYGIFISKLIDIKALSLNDMDKICDKIKDAEDCKRAGIPPAAKLAGSVLGETKKLTNEKDFVDSFRSINVDLQKYWYDKLDIVLMVNWVKEHNLECISRYNNEFEELIKRIGVDPTAETLNFINSSFNQFIKDSDEFGRSISQIIANDLAIKNITESEKQKEYIKNVLPLINTFVSKDEAKTNVLKAIEPIFLRKRLDGMFVDILKILKEENFINKNNIDEFIRECKAFSRTKALYKDIN